MIGLSRRMEIAAQAFWAGAGGRKQYGRPVDLRRAVATGLPLAVCHMPSLSTAKVAAVLTRMRAVPWSCPERALRGCLVADLGVGLVFVDGSDPPEEQLYSLAHEVAHFLLHYLEPRARALASLGAGIIEVLDRHRPPTTAERLSSALMAVPLQPFRHAIERTAHGQPRHLRTESIEIEADGLALELLAPLAELRKQAHMTGAELAAAYGLPVWAAERLPTLIRTEMSAGVISLFKK